MSYKLKKQIGLRIKAIRLKNSLTQAKLAELINLEPNTIAKLERGESFSLDTLEKISNILKVHPRLFFDFENIADETEENQDYIVITDAIKHFTPSQLKLVRFYVKSVSEMPDFKFYKTKDKKCT